MRKYLIIVFIIIYGSIFTLNTNKIYSQDLFSPEQLTPEIDKFLKELEQLNEVKLMQNAPRKNAILLRMLVEMINAKNALEVGTSNGYSAIWIGLGLKSAGGHLTTLEIDPERVKMARENTRVWISRAYYNI